MTTTFYLGTHMPNWLDKVDVPLVVSRRTLARYQSLPRATCRWGLDSGGFTELGGKRSTGRWEYPANIWARFARRLYDEVGGIDWIAPQDWMCEPSVRAKTGLTVEQHQRLTVDNYLELRSLDPALPWMPVLQGWDPDDYRRCIDIYNDAGVDLSTAALVGLGTVCRRQATREIGALVSTLAESRLRLHGFGVKMLGLKRYGWALSSADSAAWSLNGRKNGKRCQTTHPRGGKTCANCLPWALEWRERVLSEYLPNQQPSLFGAS